jgi:mono/diheme cytochrome c family protein
MERLEEGKSSVSGLQRFTTREVAAMRFVAFLLFTCVTVGPAFGQAQSMRSEIPYQFTFGSKVLPAGTYTFKVNGMGLTALSASNGQFTQNIITWISGPAQFLRDGSLVFDKTDAGPVLSEVWMPGTNGLLLHSIPKGHSRDVLLVSGLSQSGAVSGKTAFSMTCGRCHGQDGNGDERANKFFNTAIPKLTSPQVQAKSDAELRALITQGSQTMPPVEIDESGFRHRLPPQDVDAVIAYVRTLKQ